MLSAMVGKKVHVYEVHPEYAKGVMRLHSRGYRGMLTSVEGSMISVQVEVFSVNNREIPEAVCVGKEVLFNTAGVTFSTIHPT